MNPIVSVQGLAKQYRLAASQRSYGSLRESIVDAIKAPFSRRRRGESARGEVLWALKDVTFEVAQGEALGIIGRNGAGKSTLLKILSRITHPTEGTVDLYGQVSSLLEVGAGFHPELSGRENIFLNGAILGMRRLEIKQKFDEIVAFAELEKFVDTPVKRYSSGMYMRLAFAISAHLDPEILIVDEVLAVGDARFQKKCLGKMGDVASRGRTVLFVSHNMAAIQKLCRRAIMLEEGVIAAEGPSDKVVDTYLNLCSTTVVEQRWNSIDTAPGNDKIRLRSASVVPEENKGGGGYITIRSALLVQFEYWNLDPDAHLSLTLRVYSEDEILAFCSGSTHDKTWQERPFPAGLFQSTCRIPGDLLNDGVYRIELMVVKDQAYQVHRYSDLLVFEVRDDVGLRGAWLGKRPGVVRPLLEWSTALIEPVPAKE